MEEHQPVVTESAAVAAPEYQPPSYEEYTAAAAAAANNPDPSAYGAQGGAVDSAMASGTEAAPTYAVHPSSYGDPTMYDPTYGTASTAAAGLEHTAGQPAPAVGHEATNGTVSAIATSAAAVGNGENGTLPTEAVATVDNQYAAADATDMSSEEDRLWGLVKANSLDFNSWTSLIQETEKENNIVKLRKVYDAFLAEFPLCYGYWKKYADHEARLDSLDKVVEVYERAVLAVTYSVDIWLHYCQFAISTNGDPENIRRLFERGLAYVGTDYLSYPLWDEYIHYEYSLQEWSRVAIIYTRILESPIQQIDRYFNSFKEFASSRPLSEIMTPEEAEMFIGHSKTTDEQLDGVEGEDRADADQSIESLNANLPGAEELEKYIAVREEMYKKAKELDSKIINFETAIRRPYFHVKTLDDPELENWHNYLDFMERGDDFNKLVKLYERCLIACANYPEYWIRYVLCMESSGSMELANNALARATQVFVKKQPEIHLFAARFKEFSGDILGARTEYQILYSEFSSALLEAVIRHANMEYRLGNKEAAFSVFEEAIVVEQAKDFSQILPLLYIQQSRFAFLVDCNAEKAREIMSGAFDRVQPSRPLLEAAIHLESILPLPKRIDYIDSLVDKFITPIDNSNEASTTDREDISSIFLEFLDIFGNSQSIKKAENRHAAIFLRHRSTSLPSRKRHAEDYLGSEKVKASKSYTADASGQSVMGAYPNAQGQWPAGYGQNPAWPQAPQAQGQQWNPAYASQAGYGSYGAYPYTQPQAAVSTPQTAAYGAYPANPAQAYPQQAYAQPAATYSQPQVPASQAYYSGYY